MAKQRGLHQIIGKFNDTCYFERKGTRGGLLRRINSGMSERVKTGEDFANLRSANSVFGACSMYAALVFNFFSSRAQFLFKKNRQSKLTTLLYKSRQPRFLSEDLLSAGYGLTDSYILALMFDSVVRRKFYEVFSGFPRVFRFGGVGESTTATLNSYDLESYCRKYNATGCYIGRVGPCYIYPLARNNTNEKFQIQDFGADYPRYGFRWRLGEGDLDVIIECGETDDTCIFGFIYAIPEVDVQQGLPIRLNNGACCGMYSITL